MFRINSRCISCGTCWQFDPEHFANGGDAAVVSQQPRDLPALHQALLALQACPVAAIEASADQRREQPVDGFPVGVTHHASDEVLYCGWASKRSFGACSWLIRRPEGNVMVDVPRWSAPLARRIEALGGLAMIVLTHRDDVADHGRWPVPSGLSVGFTPRMPMPRLRRSISWRAMIRDGSLRGCG